jgi:hypothetical protein
MRMDTGDNAFQGDFPFAPIQPQKTPKKPVLLAVKRARAFSI